MNTHRTKLFLTLAVFGLAASVRAADLAGKWSSEFDTQMTAKRVKELEAK